MVLSRSCNDLASPRQTRPFLSKADVNTVLYYTVKCAQIVHSSLLILLQTSVQWKKGAQAAEVPGKSCEALHSV